MLAVLRSDVEKEGRVAQIFSVNKWLIEDREAEGWLR
jgi:hypothetical protein